MATWPHCSWWTCCQPITGFSEAIVTNLDQGDSIILQMWHELQFTERVISYLTFIWVLSSSFKNDNRRICQVDILAAGIRPEQRAEVTAINSKYWDILRRDARLGQGYKHLYHQHQMREVRCYGDARWHSARQRVWSLPPLNNGVWKCLFMCSQSNAQY